ncbi:MAG: hypothetical protein AAGA85_26740 [Bacteroidota bacterium]
MPASRSLPISHQVGKTFLLLTPFLFALSSCTLYTPYVAQQHDYETFLPIQPSGASTELFFEDQPFPKKPFVQGGRVGVVDRGYRHSQLLAEDLRKKAQELGYDAVIDISKHTEWKDEYTFWDYLFAEDGEVYPSGREYAIMSGRGIKFTENITYLSSQRRAQRAYLVEGGKKDTLFTKTFYPDGEFMGIQFYGDESKRYHDEVIEAYDFNRLIREKEGWEYYKDHLGRVQRRRKKRFDDWVLEDVRLKYDRATSRLKEVIVQTPTLPGRLPESVTIRVSQDDLGRVVKKEVVKMREVRWMEELVYDEEGRLARSEFRRMHWEDKKMVVDYHYYSNEDLPDLIKNESNARQTAASGAPVNPDNP